MESQAGCLVYRGKAFQKLCLDENGEVVGPPEDMVFEPPVGLETVEDYFAFFVRFVPSPDGKYIAAVAKTEGGDVINIIDMTTKKAARVYFLNIKDRQVDASGSFYNWHPNGNEFLFREINASDRGLWLIDAQTSQHRLLAQPPTLNITGASISPDGQRLMYAANGRNSVHQIWTANADGSDPQLLVDGGGVAVVWEWSPDGRYVVYKGEPSGGGLWVMDRTGQKRKQVQGPYLSSHGFNPVWSLDGKHLAYVGAEQLDPCWEKDETYRADPLCRFKGPVVYVENVDTGELRLVATNAIDPAWTLGGALLMPRMDENGQIDIWWVNVDGTDLRRLTNTVEVDRYPVWLPQ
jgi:Tol biopolymer transport system component